MKLSKKISTLILSVALLIGSFGQANAAKRLHAAIADWTGGIITCEVAVAILEREMGYKIKQTVFPSGTGLWEACLLYTSPSPRDISGSRMPSSA